MELMQSYIENMTNSWRKIEKTKYELKQYELHEDSLRMIYGTLMKMAVNNTYSDSSRTPLNINQSTEFIRKIESSLKTQPVEEDMSFTAWDLVNVGTNILKPETADTRNLLMNNANLVDFIYEMALIEGDKMSITEDHPLVLAEHAD